MPPSRNGTYSLIQDTEFPGNFVKKHTLSPYYAKEELDYQFIWHNVEHTKLIQVGLSVGDHLETDLPHIASWQFNLQFDLAH